MPALLKTSLIFAAVGLLATFAAAFIPYAGIYAGAPLAAACAGAGAGYFGARHETGRRALNIGVIAGALAGTGTLFSPMLFIALLILLLRTNPAAFYSIIRTYYAQAEEWMDAKLLLTTMSQYALRASMCSGIINLLSSVAGGLLGGWVAVRLRGRRLVSATQHDEGKPHPRVFVSLCGATIFAILFLYSLLILYPAYQSGIYRSEYPEQETFAVPFYTYDSPGYRDSRHIIWALSPLIDIAAWLFFPPLSIALLAILIRRWRLFTSRERVFWVTAFVVVWIGFVVTFPAAAKFGIWYAD